MKARYAILLVVSGCLFFPILAFGVWQPDGTALSTVVGSQQYPAMIPDGAGGAIVTWSDHRSGTSFDIYAQRVGALGAVQWTADGVALCTATGDQTFPTIVPDGGGGAIVTWTDEATYNIRVQRIDASGTVQWTANGVALYTGMGQGPTLVPDGAGGAIVAWFDHRNGIDADIFAQRVDASGSVLWATDGIALSTATFDQAYPTIVSDGSGGAIVAWNDARNSPGTGYDIFAQRVNASGVAQWTADGVALCTAPYSQDWLRIISDGAGGAILAWSDVRTFIDYDIYAQRIDASGSVQWSPNGVALCTATKFQYCYGVVPDGAGGMIVTWQDYRNGSNYDVYAQRIDASGAPQWMADGAILCTPAGGQNYPAIASDGAGGAIVTWQNVLGGVDIYAQRIDVTGALQWAAGGVALCTATNNQYDPKIVSDGAGGAIVAWHDIRGWGVTYEDVYAQRVNADGLIPTAVSPTTPSLSVTVGDNYPNPFATGTAFELTLRQEANVELEVFDATGRRVRMMNLGKLHAGASRLSFDGRDDRARALPSGVYFCRLRAAGETVTKKMVIAR